MSDKPKTLEQAFESFEKAFTPPISLTFNEKLLVEIFWNDAIESRNEEITGLKINLIESDAKIESMQSELDKRDARIEELEGLILSVDKDFPLPECRCDSSVGFFCAGCVVADEAIKIVELNGAKDE